MVNEEKNFRKKLIFFVKVISIVILIAFLLVFNVPIPIRIETVALEIFLDNPDHVIERTVVINGWHRINLLTPYNRFNGSIVISGYDVTNQAMDTLRLHRSFRNGHRFDLLFFASNRIVGDAGVYTYSQTYDPFGVINSRLMFRNAFIVVSHEGYIATTHSPLVVLNASNRDDAVEILRNFGIYE